MKKYKSYLESLVTNRKNKTIESFKSSQKILTLDETVDFIKENCKEFLKYPVKIKRGIYNDNDYLYIEPVERHSLENLDFYNLIIDNDPSWEGYPKRLKSLCCILKGKPNLGNKFYYVIPVDGSKWGLCTGSDLFVSFNYLEKNTNNLYINEFFDILNIIISDNYLEYICDKCNGTGKNDLGEECEYCQNGTIDFQFNMKLDDTNYDIFKKQLDKIDSILNKNPRFRTTFMTELFKFYYIYDNDTLFNMIIDLMNPIKNNFKIQTLKKLYNSSKYRKEIWTESPCILIYDEVSEDIFNKLNIQIRE
ncbi:hypothetical protein M0Q97_12160 [Candidatus Dojkabacteria bacterium]|nr:hypothetical protein [Candidatus Dojkabacteria bacterium]